MVSELSFSSSTEGRFVLGCRSSQPVYLVYVYVPVLSVRVTERHNHQQLRSAVFVTEHCSIFSRSSHYVKSKLMHKLLFVITALTTFCSCCEVTRREKDVLTGVNNRRFWNSRMRIDCNL